MKTFNQFKHDMNEGVAALAIPAVGAGIFKKIVASGALKAISSGALTGGALTGAYLASKKISDMSDDEIEKSGTIDPLDLGKNPQRKRNKLKNVVAKLGDEIKGGVKQVKKGLSVKPEEVKGKKYRTDDMKKGETPIQYLNRKFRKQIEKQKEQYKRERERNKRNELP